MDKNELERFVDAQRSSYDRATMELRAGEKQSHWMWYIFPQLRGLGRSETSKHFGIASLAEAQAYLAHSILGPRLAECASIVLATGDLTPVEIFGAVDALKFHSSMTLFSVASEPDDLIFARALAKFYDGAADAQTISLLNRANEPSSRR